MDSCVQKCAGYQLYQSKISYKTYRSVQNYFSDDLHGEVNYYDVWNPHVVSSDCSPIYPKHLQYIC